MTSLPIYAEWTHDGVFAPLPRFRKQCDADFVVGERYRLATLEERSEKSHRAYFATINEGWANLREEDADRFPTADHLRKFALIRCGFADGRQIVCASATEALRVAAFIKPMDTYAVVQARGPVVTVWTAKSQSMRAMGKQDFMRSQEAVREFIAAMIAVAPEELAKAEERAA
jgi:hypothetical protein